jgi:uncharacterized protein
MPSRERDGDTSTESPLQENASLDVTLAGQPAALSPSPAPPPTVVSNTTPLITLGEIGLLDILRQLYGTILIPPSVFAEYHRGRAAHPQQPDLQGALWILTQQPPPDPLVPTFLDAGERDAIALARAVQAARILIDERAARAVASRLRLTVTGSAGVLVAAKQVGLIALVKPYLDTIISQGRRISSNIYEQILRQAGE